MNAVTAVHDGFALEKSTVRSPLGGALLSRAMASSVERKGVLIRPRLSFKRIERAPGVWEVRALAGGFNTQMLLGSALSRGSLWYENTTRVLAAC